MSNHTQGTWRYAPEFSAVVVLHDYELKAVADFGKCDLQETEANARLIAAAPELLEALQKFADGYRAAVNGKSSMHMPKALADADAAIAKAIGD